MAQPADHAFDVTVSEEEYAKLPLRFIDVEATTQNSTGGICFTRSKSWHIISHTWSRYIQDLSRVIGQKVKEAADGPMIASYEGLFKNANFKDQESYQELVKFLLLVRSDGARFVWFDALCINQIDGEEMNREIQQMGSYYERSLGCYVVQHGIGRGYALLDISSSSSSDIEGATYANNIPRWFTRVWTLQEWVLPQRTTFILEELDDDVYRAVQTVMLTLKDFCPCCKYDVVTLSAYMIDKCKQQRLDPEPQAPSLQDLKSNECTQRNKSHFREIDEVGMTSIRRYFVDDLAYIFVVRLAIAIRMEDYLHQHGNQDYYMFMERLQLKTRLSTTNKTNSSNEISPEMVLDLTLREISQRFCTNEEDRVLSILKVLGVEGVVQVRTGKKLYEQVIHLARSLLAMEKQEELLVRLCLVDGWGNERPGMSWAPTLEVRPKTRHEGIAKLAYREMDEHLKEFRCVARVKDVDGATGALLLESCILSGHLITHNHCARDDQGYVFWDPPMAIWKDMALQLNNGCILVLLCACVTQEVPHVCLLKPAKRWSTEQGSIILIALGLHEHLYALDRVPISLVLMGEGYSLKAERKTIKIMHFVVCVGNEGGPFHKVGYLGIPSSLFIPQEMPTPTCATIGGFGDDLGAYITHGTY